MTVLVVNLPASDFSEGVASSVTAIGPALIMNAASTDPPSSQPRFDETSLNGASGPGSMRLRSRRTAIETAIRGGMPTARP